LLSLKAAATLSMKAETAGFLESAQRTDVVDRVFREMRKSGSVPDPTGFRAGWAIEDGLRKPPQLVSSQTTEASLEK
jgi:pentatricopeptide repeat protein